MLTYKFIEKCVRENAQLKVVELPPEPKYKTYLSTFTFLLDKLDMVNINDLEAVAKKRFEMAQEFMEYYNNFSYHREMKHWLNVRGMKTRMKEVIGDLSSTHISQNISIRVFEFLCKWYNISIQYGICVFNRENSSKKFIVEFVEKNETVREKENKQNQITFDVPSLETPLSSLSNYKKADLIKISEKVLSRDEEITYIKTLTKSDIYNYLWKRLYIYSKIEY